MRIFWDSLISIIDLLAFLKVKKRGFKMANKEVKVNEIKVTFETITPLCTGDAW